MADSRIWGTGKSKAMHLSPDGKLRRCTSPEHCKYRSESIKAAVQGDPIRETKTLDESQRLFHETLQGLPDDHIAIKDLAKRKIPREDKCLGWINGYNTTMEALESDGATKLDLLQSGLADTRVNGTGLQFFCHDRLSLAVMSPDGDHVAAYYARSYDDGNESSKSFSSGLKYVRSRPASHMVPSRDAETGRYGQLVSPLFLADRAASAARREKKLFVVEGQFDALASWYGGVKNTVAAAGATDFYRQQLDECKALMGGDGTIVLCLDNDEAGLKGMMAVARRFPNENIDVVMLAGGKDPCEYRAEHGDGALQDAMGDHKPIMKMLVSRIPLSEVPQELAGVTDLGRREELASYAVESHVVDSLEAVGIEKRLLEKAARLEPRRVKTEQGNYRERRRWVQALGVDVRSYSKGKSLTERLDGNIRLQLMARLAAAAVRDGVELPKSIESRLPSEFRNADNVSALELGKYLRDGDTVDSLVDEAKRLVWMDLK